MQFYVNFDVEKITGKRNSRKTVKPAFPDKTFKVKIFTCRGKDANMSAEENKHGK